MSQNVYYAGLFVMSLFLTLIYIFRWHKQFNVDMTAFFVLMPAITLSYYLLYALHDITSAREILIFIYMGACFFPWLTTMCELDLCHIKVSRVFSMTTFLICAVVFLCDIVVRDTDLLYTSLSFDLVGSTWVLSKEYGSFQLVHYIYVIVFFVADFGVILYSLRKKKQVSRIVLLLLCVPVFVTILGYLAGSQLARRGFELTPLTYVMGQIVFLLIVQRMAYYNVSEMVVESMVESGEVGFITVDYKGRYLGSNETARKIIPDLNSMTVDRPVEQEQILDWLERFRENSSEDRFLYTPESDTERIFLVRVNDLYYDRKRSGFQIFIEDDTANQRYIKLMDRYNDELQKEVSSKTRRIARMSDQFILGMASIVESRDNSTGGHIRRTSEGVRLLTEAIREDNSLNLSEAFCEKLIKAAPMHDLGKITVDDAILRKPGRYTVEEFNEMKGHAAEGARIVHEVLKDIDDVEFREIAENVAHYHHERYDGSGYPEGLKGDEIPLEARIMAIADVYDALVSKRVYKERFSFEKANAIILEGMGSQFDPNLRRYYEAARPELESYYRSNM